jgi:MFS transporter, DHA1 family, inner membrane transport protein
MLVPLCLTGFVGYLNLFGLTPFVAEIADDLGISVALVGAAITSAWLVSAGAGLLIGPVAAHYGPRRTLVAGLVCIAISASGTALASEVWLLVVSRIVGGLGAAVAAGVTLAIAADHFEGNRRRLALSIISSAIAVAVMAGLLMLTTISTVAGWRGALHSLGGLSIVTIPLALLLLTPDSNRARGLMRLTGIAGSYRRLLSGSPATGLILACFLHGVTLTGLTTYLGAFLSSEYDLSTQTVGVVMSVLGGGYFVGTILAGKGFRRLSLRSVYALTAIVSGVSWMVLFSSQVGFPGLLAVVALTTLASGIGWVCLITLVAEHSGKALTVMMVLSASVLNSGSAFGSGLGSVILSFAGYQVVGFSLALFVIVAAPVVLRRDPDLAA